MADPICRPLDALSARDQLREALKTWGYSPEVVQVTPQNGTGVPSFANQSVVILLTAEHSELVAVLLSQAHFLGEVLERG